MTGCHKNANTLYPSIKNEKSNKNIQVESMGLFGAAKADPKKQVNEMSQLLRRLVINNFTS